MSELDSAKFGLIVSEDVPLRQFNQEQAEAFQQELVGVVAPFKGRDIDRGLIDEIAQEVGIHLKKSFAMVPGVAIRAAIGEDPGELIFEILFLPKLEGSDV